MRLRHLCCAASALLATAPAAVAEPVTEVFVAEFRVAANGRAVEALGWRSGDDIAVMPETLRALGLRVAADAAEAPLSISSVPGAQYRFSEADQAVDILCDTRCFHSQTLAATTAETVALSHGRGGFLGIDLVANRVGGRDMVAGAFDLGLFAGGGHGGTSFTLEAGETNRAVRLETAWTIDFLQSRRRLRIGDGVVGGGLGAPFRYGGLQYATEFSLDPTFIRYPIPTFEGEAATPSVVDLYINGALRARERVDAGPFEIIDAPLGAGGGVAQVVVTDVLGRQHVVSAPFYASPSLLRPGLDAVALAGGAERHNYGVRSHDYGPAFGVVDYRRGLFNWLTAAARLELGEDGLVNVSGGAFFALTGFGQIDVVLSQSESDIGAGGYASIAWSRQNDWLTASAQVDTSTPSYRRLGEREAPPLRARASLGVDLGAFGSAALTAASADRRQAPRASTLELSYTAPATQFGVLSIAALYVEERQSFTSLGVSLVRPLGARGSAAFSGEFDRRGAQLYARAQSSPPPEGGLGWRAALGQGETERFDGAIALRGRLFEARLEASRASGVDGLRGQFATAIVFLENTITVTQPIRDSFAIVEVGAPNVDIYRDRQRIGRTNARGRLLVTGVRAYEANRIGIDVDDLPLGANVLTDEVAVRVGERSGAVVRMPVRNGRAGEVRVLDETGAPLPAGTILVRDLDLMRFPVGRDGRVYLSEVSGRATLTAEGKSCRAALDEAMLTSGQALLCVVPGAGA